MKEVLGAIELPVGSGGNRTDRDCIKENTLDAAGVSDIAAAYRIAAVGRVFGAGQPLSLTCETLHHCAGERDRGVVTCITWSNGRSEASLRPGLHRSHVGGDVAVEFGQGGHGAEIDRERHDWENQVTRADSKQIEKAGTLKDKEGVEGL